MNSKYNELIAKHMLDDSINLHEFSVDLIDISIDFASYILSQNSLVDKIKVKREIIEKFSNNNSGVNSSSEKVNDILNFNADDAKKLVAKSYAEKFNSSLENVLKEIKIKAENGKSTVSLIGNPSFTVGIAEYLKQKGFDISIVGENRLNIRWD